MPHFYKVVDAIAWPECRCGLPASDPIHRDPAAEGEAAARADAMAASLTNAAFVRLNPAYRRGLRDASHSLARYLYNRANSALRGAGFAEWEPNKQAGHSLKAAYDNYDPDAYGVSEPVALLFGYLDDRDGGDGLMAPLAGTMVAAYAAALTAAKVPFEQPSGEPTGPCLVVTGPVATEIECPVCDRTFDAYTAAACLPANYESGECPPCARLVSELADRAEAEGLDPGLTYSAALAAADAALTAIQRFGDR